MNKLIDVRVDRLVYGGDGIGRMADERAIFVTFLYYRGPGIYPAIIRSDKEISIPLDIEQMF